MVVHWVASSGARVRFSISAPRIEMKARSKDSKKTDEEKRIWKSLKKQAEDNYKLDYLGWWC